MSFPLYMALRSFRKQATEKIMPVLDRVTRKSRLVDELIPLRDAHESETDEVGRIAQTCVAAYMRILKDYAKRGSQRYSGEFPPMGTESWVCRLRDKVAARTVEIFREGGIRCNIHPDDRGPNHQVILEWFDGE